MGNIDTRKSIPSKTNNMENLFKNKKFGDDMLAELSYVQFQEAKKRLRHFVINTDMQSDKVEKEKLLNFFKHRQYTLVMILKECYKARKANGGTLVLPSSTLNESKDTE
jgi:hypothetical protein